MQTLVSQLTTTFVDDAIELARGFGKVIVQIVTAPIERIANACDVGGVLAGRQSAQRRRDRDVEDLAFPHPAQVFAVAVQLPAPPDLRRGQPCPICWRISVVWHGTMRR